MFSFPCDRPKAKARDAILRARRTLPPGLWPCPLCSWSEETGRMISRPPTFDAALRQHLRQMAHEGRLHEGTLESQTADPVAVFSGEFWTSRQRAAHRLHEVSYRACFKPQLPRFFIDHLTAPGDLVYDPFGGRGTTALEAVLQGRDAVSSDVNPLSAILLEPRFNPPPMEAVETALAALPRSFDGSLPEDLLTFYHPETLRRLCAMRAHWIERGEELTPPERWIRMVATNRLTGHSPGFFSVYTMPPNQAVSVVSQKRINEQRGQKPPLRDVDALILRKSRQLQGEPCDLFSVPRGSGRAYTASAGKTPFLDDDSVDLIVTSPPFLDIVDYAGDNWLRGWFNGIDPQSIQLWVIRKIEDWTTQMTRALEEMRRVLKRGAHVAFEVGEVRRGTVRLEEQVVQAGRTAGLTPVCILINVQKFTKTANCWGVDNGTRGTNTNRIVLFRKD